MENSERKEWPPITRVMIVGAGWVGRQLGARLAVAGISVSLVDKHDAAVSDAIHWMQNCDPASDQPLKAGGHEDDVPVRSNQPTQSLSDHEFHTENSRVTTPPASHDWLKNVVPLPNIDDLQPHVIAEWQPELAIECVSEQLSLKKRVLRRISELVPAQCIIASNSSYFVPSLLCPYVSHPQRYVHLHFHVPVLRDSVVDIVGCQQTEPNVLIRLQELARRIDQYPLVLRREHPGYVFNWLLQSVLRSALELVALDVVDSQDVDRSWKAVTGMSVGPFEMMDQIGLDVIDQVLSNARWMDPPNVNTQQLLAILRPLIQQGRLGVKSGSGFYEYRSDGRQPTEPQSE